MDHTGDYSIANFRVAQDSPLKRRRVDSSDLPPIPPAAPPAQHAIPLRPLPAPLALLAVAHSLRTSALSLLPSLAKPPRSHNSHVRYSQAWSDYYRMTTASLVVLRSARDAASVGEYRGGRIELRANAMLAEQLADVYEGNEHVEQAVAEGEVALTRAQAIAQSHPTLFSFVPSLTLLQVRLALLSSKRTKYARTLLKKLLSSPLLSSNTPESLAALYSTHSTLATLPAIPYSERIAAWQNVAGLARHHGDIQVQVIATLAMARLSLEADDCETARHCLNQIQRYLGPSTDSAATDGSPTFATAIKVEFRLIASLLAAHLGDVKEAKEILKTTHALLDSADATTPAFSNGIVAVIGRNDPNAVRPATVSFQLPAHSALYSFTYLASVAVHRDPYGKAPRSALFVQEGIRVANSKLEGKEPLLPITRISSMEEALASTLRLKVHLHLFACELAIMRSHPADATQHLLAAVSTMRVSKPGTDQVWQQFKQRSILDLGLIHLSKDEEDEAEKCFEVAIDINHEPSKVSKGKTVVSMGATVTQLAELSLLVLKLSQGHSVAPSSNASMSSSPIMSRSTSNPTMSSATKLPATTSTARLETLARNLTGLEDTSPSTPTVEFIVSLTKALTCREITKSKSNLSNALNSTTKLSANHARALTLALLANLFEQTRNTEALKMLNSSLRLVQGMGGRIVPPESAGTPNEAIVGNARLGLWLGERLLSSLLAAENKDQGKIEKQRKLNEAHRIALRQEGKSL
ncbi:uncharacterized protein JCM15063_001198 [Sporobolomyces koalae]|uniref:uncharacterized protein n=1 Tax=Sporobolomyces koalae TaxID=500713 RepID=UPI003182A3C5